MLPSAYAVLYYILNAQLLHKGPCFDKYQVGTTRLYIVSSVVGAAVKVKVNFSHYRPEQAIGDLGG